MPPTTGSSQRETTTETFAQKRIDTPGHKQDTRHCPHHWRRPLQVRDAHCPPLQPVCDGTRRIPIRRDSRLQPPGQLPNSRECNESTTGRFAQLPQQHATGATSASNAITFAQHTVSVAGNDGLTHKGIECCRCHSIGHYASNCPAGSDIPAGTTLTHYAYMMAQQTQGSFGIDPLWILLDSQSTLCSIMHPC